MDEEVCTLKYFCRSVGTVPVDKRDKTIVYWQLNRQPSKIFSTKKIQVVSKPVFKPTTKCYAREFAACYLEVLFDY